MLEVRVYHKESDEYVGSFPTDAYGNTFETVANNTEPCNYLTFDGNGINLLDNNLKFYEDGDYMGYTLPYISSENRGVNYDYAIKQTEPLIFDFSSVTQKPQNITVLCREVCIGSFKTVITRNVNGVKITSTETKLIHHSDRIVISLSEDVSKVELYFLSALAPNQYITITSVFYGTINTFNKFTSHNLIEEINVLSDDLPINQFEATIVNPDHIEFAKKDSLAIFSNKKYYGSFYITNVQRSAEKLYDIVAQNSIYLLDAENYNSWNLGANHYLIRGIIGGLIYKIKNITGVVINPPSVNPEYYAFEGDLKQPTCRMVLCAIGFASGHMIDSSRSTNVSMIKIPNTISSIIKTEDRRILGDAVFKRTEEISNAIIKYTRLAFSNYPIDKTVTLDVVGGQKTIYSFDKPVSISTNIPNCTYVYSNSYSVCFIPNDGITSTTITYGELKTAETIETVRNENSSIINSKTFDKLKIKGFYNEYAGAYEKSYVSRAADVEKYIKSRGKVKAKIRLRNEKVGDLIQIETAWDGIITGIITKMDIKFGYEDIADIEVLEWNL